ncbi:hypothetical protein NADFUDRAFT_71619 [Nadsonia fulvescens var. elongata DSM 6958]|uniref:Uncharacterized protein n=1 Tax=Nadsonia fulvescens var. elongata DSM 6958 TaxID=857566 RepID=A0A1E3PFD3_9ASCO|nr:hypothetical protein NADFUDRAFT_71619 [Nadsonia fulvescens var. elongata DSM 6958]
MPLIAVLSSRDKSTGYMSTTSAYHRRAVTSLSFGSRCKTWTENRSDVDKPTSLF